MSRLPAMIELRIVIGPLELCTPPPAAFDPAIELPKTVLFRISTESIAKTPPPSAKFPVVELPEMVLLTIVTEPALMPPPRELAPVVVLPETVTVSEHQSTGSKYSASRECAG